MPRREIATPPADAESELDQLEFEALAGFRYELRKFMAFSQRAAEARGLKPQQYQALLAIRAHDNGRGMSLNSLAHELFIGRSTAVELANRLEARGMIERRPAPTDGRKTLLRLTPDAARALASLAAVHRNELREQVPALISLLSRIRGPKA